MIKANATQTNTSNYRDVDSFRSYSFLLLPRAIVKHLRAKASFGNSATLPVWPRITFQNRSFGLPAAHVPSERLQSLPSPLTTGRRVNFQTILFAQGSLLLPQCLDHPPHAPISLPPSPISRPLLLGSGEVETLSSKESLFWVLGFIPVERWKESVSVRLILQKKFWPVMV